MIAVAVLCLPARAQVDAPRQFDGVVVARYDAALALPVSGVVAEITVTPGEQVEAGQQLIRLDDAQARLAAEAARLSAEHAEAEVDRATQALKTNRDAETDLQQQQRLRDIARLEYQLAQARLERHTLSAPVAGVVVRIDSAVGEFAAAGQPLLRLVQLDRPLIEAQIPSDVADDLTVGDEVTIVPIAAATRSLSGRVAYVSPVIDPQSDSRFARIEPSAQPGAPILRVGARVSVGLLDDTDADTPAASP